jgi:RluA family pseudouridine synthase
VVDKPPGLPTQPTVDAARPHLFGAVKRYLEARGRPSYLGMHQRLDRDTSGVVVFTTDPRANAGLAAQFEQRGLEKTYLALTRRPPRLPPASWRASSPLTAGRGPRVTSGAGGAAAETAFRRVETLPQALLVEARPRTGRKHQVRVHLADGGLPILGDDVYGTPTSDPTRVPRLMLHAWRLDFRHPLTAAALALESPLPADFTSALACLRRA